MKDDPRDRMTPDQRKWYDDGWQRYAEQREKATWWSGWWAGVGMTATVLSTAFGWLIHVR